MLHQLINALEPQLQSHCKPTNEFLRLLSSTFHTCIPTPLAFVSNTLGIFSIVSWLFAQLPQIYKNWSISSTSGLSIFFLVEWCLGDLSNLLGALFTHQASWQVVIGCYYVFVDLCLVGQWLWYEKLRHGRLVRRIRRKDGKGPDDWDEGAMEEVMVNSETALSRRTSGADTQDGAHTAESQSAHCELRPSVSEDQSYISHEKPSCWMAPVTRKSKTYRSAPATSASSTPPRTMLLIACLAAVVQASPVSKSFHHPNPPIARHATPLENAGTALSWMSTALYLFSRLPQLIKNWRRQSTAGLSPLLFAAAFCGNFFYSSALITNPRAWNDFDAYGGGGWVGSTGSERRKWLAAALPFFLGAAGVLGMDASVGVQFMLYGEGSEKVVVIDQNGGRRWRWRRVSGWMRGWVPSMSESKSREHDTLLDSDGEHQSGYGAVS